jgi:hypothetical protein
MEVSMSKQIKKRGLVLGLFSFLGVSALLLTLSFQQGCQGGPAALSAMVAPATSTITPVPTPAYPTCTNTSTPVLISDFENGGNQLLANQCRSGYWFNYNDGTGGGTQTFNVASGPGVGYNGTGTSLHCVEVTTNSGFTNYGAGFGLSFINNPSPPPPTPVTTATIAQGNYDAYGYHGIQFYGKNTTGAVLVTVNVPDFNVAITSYGSGAHFVNVTLNTSWQLYQITMSQLISSANGYGTATAFDPSKLQQMEWQVGKGVVSDVWIDNVSFY